MRAGRWDRSALLGTELRGRTLGIVGLGRIGGEIAARARAFGMPRDRVRSVHHRRALRAAAGHARADSLDELLESADIVTIHTPLTPETRGMIRARELALLRDGAVIANLARGGIVDEADLVAELARGRLRGAMLDVFDKEPLAADHPLRTAPNVILTPHLGASTAEGQRNVVRRRVRQRARRIAQRRAVERDQRRGRRARAMERRSRRDGARATRRRRWLARCSATAAPAPSAS